MQYHFFIYTDPEPVPLDSNQTSLRRKNILKGILPSAQSLNLTNMRTLQAYVRSLTLHVSGCTRPKTPCSWVLVIAINDHMQKRILVFALFFWQIYPLFAPLLCLPDPTSRQTSSQYMSLQFAMPIIHCLHFFSKNSFHYTVQKSRNMSPKLSTIHISPKYAAVLVE